LQKSTLDASKYGFTQKRDNSIISEVSEKYFEKSDKSLEQNTAVQPNVAEVKSCRIDNPDCESCQ